ncbi:hypothetical protein [Nonomuraea salmonea]|uniref:hypothetical protein n=1 Tax=Nonomuraea salmonea TaxID=46181 RepID=UPI0031E9E96A
MRAVRIVTGMGLLAALLVPAQATAEPVAPRPLNLVLDGRSFTLDDAFAILGAAPSRPGSRRPRRPRWRAPGRARWPR